MDAALVHLECDSHGTGLVFGSPNVVVPCVIDLNLGVAGGGRRAVFSGLIQWPTQSCSLQRAPLNNYQSLIHHA